MRPTLLPAALLCLAALVGLPAADAQEVMAAVPVLEDVEGDAPVLVGGQATSLQRWPFIDLRGLSIQEGNQTFTLVLTVAGFTVDAVSDEVDYAYYLIDLVVAERPYMIDLFYEAQYGAFANWCSREGSRYECYESLDVILDATAGTFTMRLPRELMVAADGSSLVTGDVINGFKASAESGGTASIAVSAQDAMPDSGLGTIAYVVQTGMEQSGTVTLDSPTPVRVSNGEATTFLYRLTVGNGADRRDTIELTAEGIPNGWIVTFPQEELRIEKGEAAEVAALVTVPFNHAHGTYSAFNVTATSRSDPLSHAKLELGVRYTRVPQPAGHHNTVWLHDDSGFFYFNALEEEEVPDDEETSSFSGTCSFSNGSGGRGESQLVNLMPDLEMGLDTALDRTGTAHLIVQASAPVDGTSSVSGYFIVWDDDSDDYVSPCFYEAPETAILEIARSEPLQLEADTPEAIDLVVTPLPYGDRIDYTPGLHMGLLLIVWDEGPASTLPTGLGGVGGTGVQFVEGSSFQLPLEEYHDPVDEYFSSLSGIELSSSSDQQRLVNPGETVVFRLVAENIGLQPASFDLELTGANTAWARILGDTRIAIGAGETRDLAVAVDAPEGAFTGEMADVTLHAVKADDDNVRSLIRLLATVDDTEDHADDSDQVGDIDKSLRDKDASALPWMGVVVALALIAARRRR